MEMPAAAAAPPLLKGKPEIIERGLIGIQTSAIRPQYSDVLRREIQDLLKLHFALPDLLFRLLTFGDIDHDTAMACYAISLHNHSYQVAEPHHSSVGSDHA